MESLLHGRRRGIVAEFGSVRPNFAIAALELLELVLDQTFCFMLHVRSAQQGSVLFRAESHATGMRGSAFGPYYNELSGSARVHLVTKPVRRCYLSSLAGVRQSFSSSLAPVCSHGCTSEGRSSRRHGG